MNKHNLITKLRESHDITKHEATTIVDDFSMKWPQLLQKVTGSKSVACVLYT
jgi:nucleoid DNA-binding protein